MGAFNDIIISLFVYIAIYGIHILDTKPINIYAYYETKHIIGTKYILATFFFYLFFPFLGLLPMAHGGSQARGPIRAVAARLLRSHSNARSKPRLRPTPQLTAKQDPQPTEQGQGSNLQPHGSQSDSLTTAPRWELLATLYFMSS